MKIEFDPITADLVAKAADDAYRMICIPEMGRATKYVAAGDEVYRVVVQRVLPEEAVKIEP